MDDYLRREEFFKDAGLPLAVVRRDPQPPFPLHSHEFAELVIVYRGRGIHFTEENEREITVGDVFLLHGNRRHGYRRLDELALINLIFVPENLAGQGIFPALHLLYPQSGENRPSEPPLLRLDYGELDAAMALITDMEQEEKEKKNAYRLMMTASFLQLLTLLLRRHQTTAAPTPSQRLADVIRYIETRYNEDDLTLEKIAKFGNFSASTLSRHFRHYTGFTPVEYLINYRIKKACAALLAAPEKSIAEIGFESGFSDSNYFTRTFRSKTGKSPREFKMTGTLTG